MQGLHPRLPHIHHAKNSFPDNFDPDCEPELDACHDGLTGARRHPAASTERRSTPPIPSRVPSSTGTEGAAQATATYFTGPPSAPPSINDVATSEQSTLACLPLLRPLLAAHDAVLVACYSAHPLVPQLRALAPIPVAGIMEASLYHALALLSPTGRVGVVTTGRAWEPLLAAAAAALLGGSARFGGVCSTGLDADQLHAAAPDDLAQRLSAATRRLVAGGDGSPAGPEGQAEVEVVCLGCAGMVGLRDVVLAAARDAGRSVRVVDGVEAGVGLVLGMVGRRYHC